MSCSTDRDHSSQVFEVKQQKKKKGEEIDVSWENTQVK